MGCLWGDTARVLGDWGLRIGCDEVVGREEVVFVDEESVIYAIQRFNALTQSSAPIGCWL